MKNILAERTIIAAGIVAGMLFMVIGLNSTRWIGTTFPGFFVMANRVVPSSAAPNWEGDASGLFQQQVLAVENAPVSSAAEVYEAVRQRPPGSLIRYSLRASDGATRVEIVRSRRFGLSDYSLIFGAFLVTALAFIVTGLVVFWFRPDSPASLGLFSSCFGLGLFALTGVDLYGPHWFFRLHAFAEALFPAGFIHLALTFPTDRLRGRHNILLAVYLPFVVLAIFYQCVLYSPSAYSVAHLAASAAHGLAGIVILGAVLYDRLATESALVRWRVGIVGAGAVTAFVGPTILMGASGVLGGTVAVNGAAFTAFIFPISLGYAILRRDLFEIDGFWQPVSNLVTRTSAVSSWLLRPVSASGSWLRRLNAVTNGRLAHGSVVTVACLAAMLTGITAANSTQWLGRTFPGFFVMHNRVIPSVSLPGWEIKPSAFFQHELVAIDGAQVASADDAFLRLRRQQPGTPIQYTLRGPDGVTTSETVPVRRFSEKDYASLFGPYLFTGISFVVAGLVVFFLRPGTAIGLGMLSTGMVGGLFAITAADLYGPHWFFRLHVMLEALVPASLVHLALVFPTNRLRGDRRSLLVGLYLTCMTLAAAYQLALYWPTAYSAVHLVATAAQGIGGLTLIWTITYDLITTPSVLVRRRILVAAVGTLAAFFIPTLLMGASGLADGSVAVNSAALTGFLFPLCFAYVMVRRDLLKIDIFMQRVAALLILAVTSSYFAVFSGLLSVKSRMQ